ncbi:hypothetical protein [Mesorhizobium sp. BR1-1-16]|uniref:hypothetical protein n=1 Tax=Mesorhizobium sp. BR1-1-16 TaxID=2876653 RepID=UPI00336A45AB
MFSLANLTRPAADPKIIATGPSSLPGSDRLARGLGWFSIGLGLTELLAPKALTRWLGMSGMEGLVRCVGVREIAAGVLTLSTEKRTGVASRIFGDGLDIAALATALGPHNPKRHNAGLALALVAGVTLLDIATSKALADSHARREKPRSFSDRSGFPKGTAAAHGAARQERQRKSDQESAREQPRQAGPHPGPKTDGPTAAASGHPPERTKASEQARSDRPNGPESASTTPTSHEPKLYPG